MAKYKDYSRFKKNELGTYLFKKEFNKYLSEKERQKKKETNPFSSAVYSGITSVLVSYILFKNFISGVSNKFLWITIGTESEKIAATFLAALFFAILYHILYLIYSFGIAPFLDRSISFIRGYFIAHESDLNKLKSKDDIKELAYIEKFNHQVADRIGLVINITDKFDEQAIISDEDKFYLSEAFNILKKAIYTLEYEIITTEFYAQHVHSGDYPALRKYRLLEIVPVCKNILSKFQKYWVALGDSYQDDLKTTIANVNRIEKELNK